MVLNKIILQSNSEKLIDIPLYFSLSALSISYSVFIFTSYTFGISDHNEQIPIIFRLSDSSYLINDWFVNQTEGFSPRFFFSHFVNLYIQYLSINLVYFILFVIFSGILIISIYLITKTLFENNLVSLLTALAFLFGPRISLGGNWITGQILVPSTLAISLITFSLYLYIIKRKRLTFFILGIATLFQSIIGLLAMGILLINEIINGETRNISKIIVNCCKYLVIYAIIGVWGFLPIIFSSSGFSNPDIFYVLTYMRHPHHYCPFSFPLKDYMMFLGMLSLFLLAIYLKYIPKNPEFHTFCVTCIVSILFLGIIGTIFVEIIPVTLIGKMQLFRINSFTTIFAYPYIFSMFLGIISLLVPRSWNVNSIKMKYFKPIIIILMIFLSCIILIQTDIQQKETENDGLYEWIRGNTPNDAIFLIPPTMEDFRLRADRAIVIDWKAFPFKDSAIIEWRDRIFDVTNNQENNLIFQGFSSYPQLEKSYTLLNESYFLYLSKKYNVEYVVINKSRELEFTELYSNSQYRVYRI